MIQTLKNNWALLLAGVSILLFAALIPVSASAAIDISQNLDCGSNINLDGSGTCDVTTGASKVNTTITTIINVFSIIVGIVAVIMLIFGGFRYVTSGGDSGNIGNAKNTILYAIVGLVIVALAQAVVQFVLDEV